MTGLPDRLSTDRLDLLPLTADALDALIRADRAALETVTGARFPDPLTAPPLMEDALPYIRDRLLTAPADLGWWAWVIVVRATKEAAGILGLAGRTDDDSAVVLGYTIYPAFERRGYATEASQAMVSWALDQPSVSRVRATIPPDHTPSLRVANKLGMRQVGTDHDDDVGDVLVYEVAAPSFAARCAKDGPAS